MEDGCVHRLMLGIEYTGKKQASLRNTKEGAHQSMPRLPLPEPSLTKSLCVLQMHFSGCFCIFSEVMVSGQV